MDNIIPVAEEIDEKIRQHFDYEIIFVNDGSTDATQDRIEQMQAKNARIRYVTFRSGVGQTEAFDAGFKTAKGEFIATMDGDGQNDPADLTPMFHALRNTDLVCGVRRRRRDSLKRRLSSKIANTARNWVTHEQITDVGCSLRIFRRRCLKNVKLYHGMHRFLPTMFRIAGYEFAEVPVNHRHRLRGLTKYGIWDRFKEGVVDLFVVRWIQNRSLNYEIIQRSGEYGLGQDLADHRISGTGDVQCQVPGSVVGQ
jgi:glycosyltransferase involved in cell wall biosynthesis